MNCGTFLQYHDIGPVKIICTTSLSTAKNNELSVIHLHQGVVSVSATFFGSAEIRSSHRSSTHPYFLYISVSERIDYSIHNSKDSVLKLTCYIISRCRCAATILLMLCRKLMPRSKLCNIHSRVFLFHF